MRKILVLFILIAVLLSMNGWAQLVSNVLPHPSIIYKYVELRHENRVKLYKCKAHYALLLKTYNQQTGDLETKVSPLDSSAVIVWKEQLVETLAMIDSLVADMDEAPRNDTISDGYVPVEWE